MHQRIKSETPAKISVLDEHFSIIPKPSLHDIHSTAQIDIKMRCNSLSKVVLPYQNFSTALQALQLWESSVK
jgi:hypothetical protein